MAASVAIIIACYNAGATVARAVQSALNQIGVAEVLVIDDASLDDSTLAARACDDGTGRLRVLVQPVNAGPAAARNRGIAESTAPWIGILDADDYFLSGRIATLLDHSAGADLVADEPWRLDDSVEGALEERLLNTTLDVAQMISLERFVRSNVTKRGRERGEMGFIKPIMCRSFLASHNIRYREDMRLGEDYEFYVRALGAGGRLLLLPGGGYVSVVRPSSLSGRHTVDDLTRLRDCDKHLSHDLPLSQDEISALRKHCLSIDCRLQWRYLILAVKRHSFVGIVQCFIHPYPVPLYLLGKLAEQMLRRASPKRVGIRMMVLLLSRPERS